MDSNGKSNGARRQLGRQTMLVQHYYEPTIPGFVIRLNGRDTVGNELGNDIEFLIRTGEGPKVGVLAVEALVALLRGVDDFKIINVGEKLMPSGWEYEQTTGFKNGQVVEELDPLGPTHKVS